MKKIKHELTELLQELHPEIDVESETELITRQILNSFDIITLISEIEDRLDVKIPVEELLPENFNSIISITDLIIRLLEEQ